jgi:hypothetical protein
MSASLALFAEYRFTHITPGFSFSLLDEKAKEKRDIKTQRALVGIAYRFHWSN